MMKKLTALLLAALLLVGTLSTALAWSCPSCGNDMSGKFCTECGTKKPEENICPSCGTNFGEATPKFCFECGTKLGEAAPAPTEPPKTELKITKQPQSVTVAEGEPAKVTVEAQGEGLTYAWYYKDKGASTFSMTKTVKTSTYVADMRGERDGRQLYCVVSDKYGNSVQTETVTISMASGVKITKQPASVTVANGETAKVTVAAEGEGLTYEWYFKNKGGDAFSKTIAFKGPEYAVEMNADRDGRQVYCVVTDKHGNSVKTETATISMASGVKITKQPASVTVANGETAKVTVAAEGEGLTYEWYFKNKGGDAFSKTTAFKGPEYAVEMNVDRDGRQVYCVVTDKHGNSVKTETVTIGMTPGVAPGPAVPSAPAESDEISDLAVAHAIDGTVRVSWSGGSAPYTVRYVVKRTGDYQADVAYEQGTGRWIATDACMENTYDMIDLVPGQDYWISVLGSDGQGRYIAYQAPEAGKYTDLATSLELIPRSRVGETVTDLASLPVALLGVDDETEHGAYIYLDYSNPDGARTVLFQLVTRLPNGAMLVNYGDFVELGAGENRSAGWDFYNLENYFSFMSDCFGGLTAGDMLVEIYLDGKLAGYGVLPLGSGTAPSGGSGLNLSSGSSTGAPVILGAKENDNGTVTLSWEDNGKGPYTVEYVYCVTGNIEEDKDQPYAWWTDTTDIAGTSHEMLYLMPGEAYWLIVSDSTGAESHIYHQMKAAGKSNLNMSIDLKPRRNDNESYTDLTAFSASALNQEYTESYGIYLDLNYKKLSEDCKMNGMFVLSMPDGVKLALRSGSINMFAAGSTYWECYTLDWAFSRVKKWYGEMLTGEYKLDVYIDGEHAASSAFQVK